MSDDILTAEKLAEIEARLRAQAEVTVRASQMLADEKSQRNRDAGDEDASYSGIQKEQTTEWIAADMLRAQAAEIERLTREVEKEGRAHSITIDQRDAAEEALGNAYTIVTGQVPEWSNLFDYNAALLEIEEASARAIAAEAKVAALEKALEEIRNHSANQDMNHKDFRVAAYHASDTALGAKP